jgi:hypothetical protein
MMEKKKEKKKKERRRRRCILLSHISVECGVEFIVKTSPFHTYTAHFDNNQTIIF